MNSTKATARRVGVLYLLFAMMQPLNVVLGSGAFIVPGDATATARNITASELTYRIGILNGFATHVIFLFLVVSLYNLFKDVDRKHAMLMVTLVTAGVSMSVANLLNKIAPLVLLSGADFLSPFTKPQLDALALGFLRVHSNGIQLAIAFWGLWLLPFGILVIRSGFIPKFLGVLLILGCFAYLTVSVTAIVFPVHRQIVDQVATPFYAVGEVSIIVWLLVKGARTTSLPPPPVTAV